MENFTYYTPTKVFFGKNQEDNIALILKEFKAKKVLLNYGKSSIIKTGLLKRIKDILDVAHIPYIELGGVEPNPKLSLVKQGIDIVKSEKIDFILAIGGGSVIDSAKSIAVGAVVDFSPWLFSNKEKSPKSAISLGVILTISASGSDMSDSCVITNDNTNEKRGFNSPLNRPKFAILNPELTYTVSPYQTSCGTVDILMHTLERFISPLENTDLTDELALGLIKSVLKAGKEALKNPYDYEARATLMWANSLSHNGLTSCGRSFIMSVHQLEHELSGMFDYVAHGAGLSALWCSWARIAYPAAKERFKKLIYAVTPIQKSKNLDQDILSGISWFENYFKEIGMPICLSELNIPEESLPDLAYNVSFKHTRIIQDIIEIDEAKALEIYKKAY